MQPTACILLSTDDHKAITSLALQDLKNTPDSLLGVKKTNGCLLWITTKQRQVHVTVHLIYSLSMEMVMKNISWLNSVYLPAELFEDHDEIAKHCFLTCGKKNEQSVKRFLEDQYMYCTWNHTFDSLCEKNKNPKNSKEFLHNQNWEHHS